MIKLYHFYYFNNMLYFKYIKERNTIECKVKNMIYVSKGLMRNTEFLVKLLDEGFTAITEKGFAVKEAESTDDKLIVSLIADLEEKE